MDYGSINLNRAASQSNVVKVLCEQRMRTAIFLLIFTKIDKIITWNTTSLMIITSLRCPLTHVQGFHLPSSASKSTLILCLCAQLKSKQSAHQTTFLSACAMAWVWGSFSRQTSEVRPPIPNDGHLTHAQGFHLRSKLSTSTSVSCLCAQLKPRGSVNQTYLLSACVMAWVWGSLSWLVLQGKALRYDHPSWMMAP